MKTKRFIYSLCGAAACLFASMPVGLASDHGDSPTVAGDQAADIADLYLFKDPVHPLKMVLIATVRGFVPAGENVNFGVFDPNIRYRFQIENTGDFRPDAFINVTFGAKRADANGVVLPQNVQVTFSGNAFPGLGDKVYSGLTVNPTLSGTATPFPAPAQKLKDPQGANSSVEVFCGLTDDPFFFDIPGFARFRSSVLAGAPDASFLSRGRDSFAGYNILTVALSIPIAELRSTDPAVNNAAKFGANVLAQRRTEITYNGEKVATGAYTTVDRVGIPAVNVALVPFNQKNSYNGSTTIDDHNGKFAAAIVGTLQKFGTPQANIDLLAGLAVANGDFLRIDTRQANGFPNGRVPADDVIDTILTVVAGGTLGDSVPANDVPFASVFPYVGLPQQPRDPSAGAEDNTRN